MITSYHHLLRGEYSLTTTELLFDQTPPRSVTPQQDPRLQSSSSNLDLQISHDATQPENHPITSENTLQPQLPITTDNTNTTETTTNKPNFLSRSFQWMKNKLKLNKVTQIKNEFSEIAPPNSFSIKETEFVPSHEMKLTEGKLPQQIEENNPFKWNFYYSSSTSSPSSPDPPSSSSPASSSTLNEIHSSSMAHLSSWAIPSLSTTIKKYEEQFKLKSSQNNHSEVVSFTPFILTTTISSSNSTTSISKSNSNLSKTSEDLTLVEDSSNNSNEMTIHVMELSNNVFRTPSTSNSEIYLIWNEKTIKETTTTSSPHENEEEDELRTNKQTVYETFQLNSELQILFLEFLELELQQYLS